MFTARANQSELFHMSSKGSSAVVILAVDVIGDSATKGYELGAGSDGKEPSFWNEYLENGGEANAALSAQDASARIKSNEVRERRRVDDCVVIVHATIAVTAS